MRGMWSYLDGGLHHGLRYEWAIEMRHKGSEAWFNRLGKTFSSQIEVQRLYVTIPESTLQQFEVRVVARLIGGWQERLQFIPTRLVCPVCAKDVSVREDMRFVPHGRLASVTRSADGKVQRSSVPCEGSEALA